MKRIWTEIRARILWQKFSANDDQVWNIRVRRSLTAAAAVKVFDNFSKRSKKEQDKIIHHYKYADCQSHKFGHSKKYSQDLSLYFTTILSFNENLIQVIVKNITIVNRINFQIKYYLYLTQCFKRMINLSLNIARMVLQAPISIVFIFWAGQ
jgi:hypothetical protein